jgi:hypothetical protein
MTGRRAHCAAAARCVRITYRAAESARFVGGAGDDAALGRVAVTADDDRTAAQLRSAQDLYRHDELVEVHVQHPSGHTSVSQAEVLQSQPTLAPATLARPA